MKNNKGVWDNLWALSNISLSEFENTSLKTEAKSERWIKIEIEVMNKWGSFKNLEVIELGSGMGTVSLLMALKGANVTLVDYSTKALEQAKVLFKNFKCNATFLSGDIINLPDYLYNKYDVSMSFGVAEHFENEDRNNIFKSHFIVLKDNGMSFISVPNKLSFPYLIWKKISELKNTWLYGLEIPFTRSELSNRAIASGYNSLKIIISPFLNSLDHFMLHNKLSRLGIITERSSFLDYHFGYALTLIGYKNMTEESL